MAREKVYASCEAAVADISDGATVLIGGFVGCGTPRGLIDALARQGAKRLTCVFSPGVLADSPEPWGIEPLMANGQIEKLITALPFGPNSGGAVYDSWQAGQLEIEVIPQGTLAERIRAGGAGIPAFYTPTGVGTQIAEGKEIREFNGREYVMELALRADFALLRAYRADTLGNTTYRGTSQNFNGVMAPAANVTIIEVDEIVEPGELDGAVIHTPALYVNRMVKIP